MNEEQMRNVEQGVGVIICYICQTPITGPIQRYKGEPIHPECGADDG